MPKYHRLEILLVLTLPLFVMVGAVEARAGAGAGVDQPRLVRCLASVGTPDGDVIEVSGWGDNGGEAAQAAVSAARYLAEMHRMIDGWPSVLFLGESPSAERLAVSDAVRATWLTARGDDLMRLPGHTIERGLCEPVELPKNKRANWVAHWGGATIEGDQPGAAIERVRRRACGRAYQRKRMVLFHAAESHAPGERFDGFRSGLKVAYKQLQHCYTSENTLDIEPGQRRRKSPSVDASVFVCIGEPPGMDVGGVPMRLATPAGVASTVEGAAESAWREWRLLVHRRALALGLHASVTLMDEVRMRSMREAYSHTFEDIGASAKLEDAVTWCWAVPEDSHKVWSWDAAATRSFECAVTDHDAVHLSQSGLREGQLLQQREHLCTSSAWSSVDDISKVLSVSSPETQDTLFTYSWATVLGCESECLIQSTLGSGDFVSVDLGGFENADEAWAALNEAIASGEVGQIAAIIPDIATSNGLEILLVEEQAFVGGLREARENGKLEELFEARLHKGRWTIHMKQR